ncbi:probable serine/threonine-protein kinase dyrk1 [Ceratitis capitata]|uniref:probable serine/threonine-protein kinase dyrk1 n=1 Tax=Ceratitis capitata TaxID=7213 RepID=UPI000329AB4C|nr:probable serine/threonine-protein kinase dyrk1 [Ceratitis capitata]
MEECQTPTLAQMMEFKYELTPTMVFDPSRLQDAQNLFVNRMNMRCFTPTMKNFQSPGLSPINEIGMAVGVPTNMENLQKSMVAGREEYFKVPFVKTKNAQQKQMQQAQLPSQQQQQQFSQQQQQQQQTLSKFSCHFVSDSPPVFTLNSTTNSDTDFSLDSTSPDSSAILGIVCKNNNNNSNNNNTDYNNNNGNSDSPNNSLSSKCSRSNATFTNSLNNNSNSNIDNNNNNNNTINNNSNASRNESNTNLLDRTMNISTLLRSAGLDEYIDVFEEQNMDLEQFLNIRSEDFARMGVCKVEDQKTLADLLCELNGV